MLAAVTTLQFDIELLRICPRAPFAAAPLAHPFWAHLGFAGADICLSDARLLASAIRAAGGAALIVPSVYRTPMVPIMAAHRIAEQHLEVMRLQRGGSFGPLEGGEAHSMWWRCYAEHRALLCDEPEPELIAIDVDLIDGHIATPAEERQLAEWQQDLPCSWTAAPEEPPSRRPALTARRGTATRPTPDPASPPAPRRRTLSLVRTEPR